MELKIWKRKFSAILHIATFKASEIDKVINDINHSDYGLTFGLHTELMIVLIK